MAFSPWLPDEDPTGRFRIGGEAAPGVFESTARLPGSAIMAKQKRKSLQDLINADPLFGQLKGQLAAQGAVDAAGRKASIQRALIQFGLVPDFAKMGLTPDSLGYLGTDVDASTRSLADENTRQGLSFKSRLDRQAGQMDRDLKNELAAHGILESGSTGYGLRENAQDYKVGLYDAEQSVMDTILGVISSYTEGERERQRLILEGLQDAADRAAGEDPGEEPEVDLDGTPTVVKKPKPKPRPLGSPAEDRVPMDGGRDRPLRKKPRKGNRNKAGQRIGGV